ncbi:DUF3019 domain-containing protein [Pseudoalteromonas shioyasakiensis]|uniref:DUF3019 domain-containing protein n=1 Tax=Pseudoalteromonas shioyasakiensis TaxID=1190813 RepID=UPI00211937A1|nr:DUF3019 domain-containing protein [Pseudoalteromonas shioyasakiensis]MCQ8877326.1 DUF3019 domain-containing protein [Pseudoalteromonas shioyasakiensis]
MKYLHCAVCTVVLALPPIPAVAKIDKLSVSPKVCVVSEQQEFCDLDLKFTISLPQAMDVCLYQQAQQLKCWQQMRSAHFEYKAHVQVETIYSLINPHTEEQIATASVAVQSTQAKTTRRRLRSPWSFF